MANIGIEAEFTLERLLVGKGFRDVRRMLAGPYDLAVDGARIEVKTAREDKNGRWLINLHRRGKLDESHVDGYVFVLLGVPGYASDAVYLVFQAPVGAKTLYFSIRSLFKKHICAIFNWEKLRTICADARDRPNWTDPIVPLLNMLDSGVKGGGGRKPYGDRPGESAAIAVMVGAKEAGKTLAQITEHLNASGIVTRFGKPWTLGAVHKIIRRHGGSK